MAIKRYVAPADRKSAGSTAMKGASMGASVGSAFGPWGTLIGGAVGGIAGGVGQRVKNRKLDKFDDKIKNLNDDQKTLFFTKLAEQDPQYQPVLDAWLAELEIRKASGTTRPGAVNNLPNSKPPKQVNEKTNKEIIANTDVPSVQSTIQPDKPKGINPLIYVVGVIILLFTLK